MLPDETMKDRKEELTTGGTLADELVDDLADDLAASLDAELNGQDLDDGDVLDNLDGPDTLGLENGHAHGGSPGHSPPHSHLADEERYGSISRTPARPSRGRGRSTPSGSMSVRVSRGGGHTHARRLFDDEDAALDLAPLQSAKAASERMVALLQSLDSGGSSSAGSAGSPFHSALSSSPTRALSLLPSSSRDRDGRPLPTGVPLEERLAGYVARVGAAERIRDEQMRETAALIRDLDGLREGVVSPEDVAFVDALIGRERETEREREAESRHGRRRRAPDLKLALDDITESEGSEATSPRSPRSPLSPLDHMNRGVDVQSPTSPSPYYPHSPRSPLSPLSPIHRARDDPTSPLSPTFASTRPGPSPPSSPKPSSAHRTPLAAATARLSTATTDATDALARLAQASSTAVQASGAAGETHRKLRGLRLGVASLRETAEVEEAAQRGVDAWEAALEAGAAPDVKKVLAALVGGFEERLGEMARAHEGLRRAAVARG